MFKKWYNRDIGSRKGIKRWNMLETRIRFTGTLEQDLKEYIEKEYSNQHGALNFTIKQAVKKLLEDYQKSRTFAKDGHKLPE